MSATIKKRITLLFETPEEIGKNLQRNDTHLTIKGDHKVVVQTRWQFIRGEGEEKGGDQIRITWKHEDSEINAGSTVINGYINAGLNVYTSDSNITSLHEVPLIETPRYNILHSDNKNDIHLKDFLTTEQLTFVDLNLEASQYDIIKTSNQTEINESWILEAKTPFTIENDNPQILNQEVGLFYIDSQDEVDVNLSGLRCLWENTPQIDRCLKTSLFFKPAFLPPTEQLTPIYLDEPVGLHPKVLVDLSSRIDETNCEYYLFAQLPLEIFVDKFQTSPVFVFGEHDLELPEYKLREKAWGSETLYQLTPGEVNELILHSRYLNITTEAPSFSNISFAPTVFKACDKNSLDIIKNPFYVKSLGLESFFTDDTKFHLLNTTKLTVPIPKPGSDDFNNVQIITGVTILFAIIYLIWKVSPRKLSPKEKKE
ncbi:protein Pbn1p [Monosporozyma unispora]|nr:protease B nonderepressible form [Kazachstania unispora]